MRDKLVLWFLGFLETMKYILEQSHGVPPVSVALDHTTLKEEGSCGYSSVKTVRSIDNSVIKFFQVDITGMVRMTSSARYFNAGVGSRRPNWRWLMCFLELPKAKTSDRKS